MSEVIRYQDRYYILATSSLADQHALVLKHGESFALFDGHGDIRAYEVGKQGLYHEGTRFVSRSVLLLGSERPLLLGSGVTEDNILASADLTNGDLYRDGELIAPHGSVHLTRSKFLHDAVCHEQIVLHNYGEQPFGARIAIGYDADFADIFEVRGTPRSRRGSREDPVVEDGSIVFRYQGYDGVPRVTRIVPEGDAKLSGAEVLFEVQLAPGESRTLGVAVSCEIGSRRPEHWSFQTALERSGRIQRRLEDLYCSLETSDERFNEWLTRSFSDLRMMTTETDHGHYPYAGVPWFSCPFGRDGLITAYAALWVAPSLAAGVLSFLAATQAREVDPARDAEPGKILHETRHGEMAATGEVPFARYYGSTDATPLFVVLAGCYHDATGDTALVERIWPNIEACLTWMDTYGDPDGDGFLEYRASSGGGLVQQGWKDSHDSVFHADGTAARGPIALCEVQGYVYAARRKAAKLATALGKHETAERLLLGAERLRAAFEDAFWDEALGTYVLALDGEKRPCRVRTSNAGHCLLTGIASPDRAARVATQLLSEDFFTGWGVRTVAASEARYSPLSYHNGSVWPHDNALIAQGLARYGFKEDAQRVLEGLFGVSRWVDIHRLPELICGFPRRRGQGPVEYPSACAPQAWASAAVFLALRACLGLSIDATERRLRFHRPSLPAFLQEVRIRDLRVGTASLDLTVRRYEADVGVSIDRREGDVQIVSMK